MQKFIECTGKTEDGAIAAALEKLGLDRDQVSVEVLQLAKPGFLGIGGTPAKVKVTYEAPDEPAAPPAVREEPAPAPVAEVVPETPKAAKKSQPAPAAAVQAENTAPSASPAADPAGDERAEKIVSFLSGLLERMEIQAVPQVRVDEEGNYLVELVGQDLGPAIGRRGETLDAIQQLTGYAVNRGQSKRVRVRVDAEGYRAKREEALERMARRVADKVVRYHRSMTLEPMNAYERHVIHTALQDYPGVTTYSVGMEPNRRTVVACSQDGTR